MSETENDRTQVQREVPTHVPRTDGLPVVPGYAVSREIARGGMGIVYAAHDATFGREVAVKVMRPGQDADRFVIESKVTAQLPHPGVPPVYALGKLADGRPFLAMKLIKGRTLAELLKDAKPSELPRLLGAFEQICQTVGYAHAHGVIHRDLKPANIMVGAFGEVQVMDWGLARQIAGEEGDMLAASRRRAFDTNDETQAGEVKGTPAYMAPEQARGEPVDARADVFALGGILAVTLTGKPPFASDTAMGTVRKAARAELRECFADLDACAADAELVAVAKRCLAPGAADRYADGQEVAAAVAAYRASVEERLRQAERDRAAAEVRAVEHRRQKRLQLLGIALMAVVMTAVGAIQQRYERREDQRKADQQLADERTAADRRATEARLEGQRDKERELKTEQARAGIAGALKLSADLRTQYRFKEASAALAQALQLAKGESELLATVEQARADLAFAVQLDAIRFGKWVWLEDGKGNFNTATAAAEYRRAFAARGLDLETLDPDEAAARVAASGVKAELVSAIDDWVFFAPNSAVRYRLLNVILRADPDAWGNRLRNPQAWEKRAVVSKLAEEVRTNPTAAPPSAIAVLIALMGQHRLDPVPLLLAARSAYPTNFDLAFTLGRWHISLGNFAGAIGPYEAAGALRPENVNVWSSLGVALANTGNTEGAIAAYRKTIELDPNNARAYFNLGHALSTRSDADGAIAAYRKSIDLDPRNAQAHSNLGVVLKGKGDLDGAIASYREAIRLAPGHAQAHTNLGDAQFQRKNYTDAIVSARAAIKADPKYSYAHALLGLVLQQTGDLSGARAALTEATRLDRRWASTLAKVPPVPVAPAPRAVKP